MSEQTLLDQVKSKLHVTWDDEDSNARIESDIMPTAEQELRSLLGIHDDAFSFVDPGTEHLLYLNYCYYEWHDAADDFEEHYASKIARCREKWMVKQYAEEQEATAELP